MTLMRFDPFRELERLADQAFSVGARATRSMPMAALRRGAEFLVFLDVPGVDPEDIDVTVERNVVSVRARRAPAHQEGDEVIIDERPHGEFTRQLFLGDNLDSDRMSGDTRDGVLTLRIPVSEATETRRVQVGTADTSEGAPQHGAASSATTGSETASAADRTTV
ncbi:Hsp20/alpha crystallin family protein [Pseudonocardia yunnanensis]